MRKTIIIIIFALGFLHANLAKADLVEIVPSDQTTDLGDQSVVDIFFDPAGPGGSLLGGFDITIGWDDSILDLFGWVTDPSGALGVAPLEIVTDGSGQINFFVVSFEFDLMPFQDQDSPFSLFTLTFDTIGLGTSPLDFLYLSLSDATGFLPIFPDEIIAGEVTVQEPVNVPEPSSLLLLLTGIGLLAAKGRSQQ